MAPLDRRVTATPDLADLNLGQLLVAILSSVLVHLGTSLLGGTRISPRRSGGKTGYGEALRLFHGPGDNSLGVMIGGYLPTEHNVSLSRSR